MRPAARTIAIVAAALIAGVVAVVMAITSDHQDDKAVWAVFGPAVGWNFIGVGLYAWRRRPESRTGVLMILLGFAWSHSRSSRQTPRLFTRWRWSPDRSGGACSCISV